MMRHGDLFSGIGGFALAARGMGWNTRWFSEIDPFACRVLKKHWPDIPNHGDIRTIDYTTVEPVDVLTAGFPCQPHSVAGKGLASADHRDLSQEVVRAIRSLYPQYAILENVPGLRRSEGGAFFRGFLGRLADIGYDAEWITLGASDVGAPHKRERIWIVAYPHSQCLTPRLTTIGAQRGQTPAPAGAVDTLDASGGRDGVWTPDVADAYGERAQVPAARGYATVEEPWGASAARGTGDGPREFWAVEPPVGRVADGVPSFLDGTVNADKELYPTPRATDGSPSRPMHCMWCLGRINAAPSRLFRSRQVRGSMSAVPREGRPERRDEEKEGDEILRCLRCGLPAKSQQEAQDVQRWVPVGTGSDERYEAVGWDVEPDIGRVASGVVGRVDRLRALGNAIVPQCAYEIFQSLARNPPSP